MEGIWGFVVIAGPIILGLALLYALLRNRADRSGIDRTEAATRELYREENEADREP